MKTISKAVAWACIVSTLFMGCYSSALIDPKGDEREKIYSGDIEYVIKKDGTKQVFTKHVFFAHYFAAHPTVITDTIRVPVKKTVLIPRSDVVRTYAGSEQDGSEGVLFVVTKDSARYPLAFPYTYVGDSLVGPTLIKSFPIPLSDVAQVSVSRVDALRTVLGVAAISAFAGLVALGSAGFLGLR
jgi:hypothetical protein